MHSAGSLYFADHARANASALALASVSQLDPSLRTGMLVATALRRINCLLGRHQRLLLLGRPAKVVLVFCTEAALSADRTLLQLSLSVVKCSVPCARFLRSTACLHFSFNQGCELFLGHNIFAGDEFDQVKP